MSQSSTIVTAPACTEERRQSFNLNLHSLKTVTWVESNPAVLYGTSVVEPIYTKARQYTVVDLICRLIAFQISLVVTLIHSVPWPAVVIDFINNVDEFFENTLEAVYQKLEWWWDWASIKFMRGFETVVIYLDKLVSFIDSSVTFILSKYDWMYQAALKVLDFIKPFYDRWLQITVAVWDYIKNVIQSLRDSWDVSKEEMAALEKRSSSQCSNSSSNNSEEGCCCSLAPEETIKPKRLSFTTDDELKTVIRRKHSDSDMSDVADIHQTTKHMVGEQTGVRYNRVHAEATVVGKKREAMYQQVTGRLQVMRKNSIRFSRGMDVRISRFIGSMQRKLTPQSVASMLLSLVKFFILFPFKVITWAVGGKSLSRRSRANRSESARRREASSRVIAPTLSPSDIKQSAEPTPGLQTESLFPNMAQDTTTHLIEPITTEIQEADNDITTLVDSQVNNLDIPNDINKANSVDSNRCDSGLSDDSMDEFGDQELESKEVEENQQMETLLNLTVDTEKLEESDMATPPSSPTGDDDAPTMFSETNTLSPEIIEERLQSCSDADPKSSDDCLSSSSRSNRSSLESIPESQIPLPSLKKTKKRVKIQGAEK